MLPDLRERLAFAVEAVRHASRGVVDHFRGGVAVELKADHSPVTVADRSAEDLLRKAIHEAYPEDGVLGEERGEEPGRSGLRWVLDPVDGTRSFVHGVPLFGVMMGLTRGPEALLGVVAIPALSELVWAARGLGAWWQPSGTPASARPREARVSTVATLAEGLLSYTSAKSFDLSGRAEVFARLRAAAHLDRGWGDCYGHLLVATGRAEVMLDPVMSVWDCAALQPILEEAGGTFTDWHGRPGIEHGEAISTNRLVLEEVLALARG